jgi:hypothetical protein
VKFAPRGELGGGDPYVEEDKPTKPESIYLCGKKSHKNVTTLRLPKFCSFVLYVELQERMSTLLNVSVR